MMRVLLLLPLAILAACASSGGSAPQAKPATATLGAGSGLGSMTMATQSNSDVLTMPFDADAIFRIMPSIYDSLAVPVTTLTPATRTIGNPSYKIRQRLGKVSLSRYLDCGQTQIGPNADSYDVVLNVTTVITPSGTNESKVTTMLEAMARPVAFNQAYNRCGTKGLFESRITDIIKARLTK